MDLDQKLCDYIFGLLEDSEAQALERELKENSVLSKRLAELNEIFGGLDSVKEDYPSPLSRMMNRFYQLSYAGLTIASAFTLFWATMFGAVSNDMIAIESETSASANNSTVISCISGIVPGEDNNYEFIELSNFRK